MIQREPDRSHLRKVVVTFLLGGLAGALCFSLLLTREELKTTWFVRQGIFVSPTLSFWVLTSLVFFFSQAASWFFTYLKGWLPFQIKSYTRVVLALAILTTLPLVLHSPLLAVPIISSFVIAPLVVASYLSLILFGITGLWHGKIAKIIIVASFMINPLAVIPDAIMHPLVRVEVFEAFRFFIGASLLSTLSGYWAAKSLSVAQTEHT